MKSESIITGWQTLKGKKTGHNSKRKKKKKKKKKRKMGKMENYN
jgi:hypothetical protein